MIKLIAFVDGSNYSKSVCDYAAWVAKKAEASIKLVHVLGRKNQTNAPADLSGSIGLGARTAILDELAELDGKMARLAHKRGRAILDDARQRIEDSGISGVTTMLRNDGIVEAMQVFEQQTNLVIIGKRGEGSGIDKMHLGSNFERVVRSSHKPILVAARAFEPVNRCLIAFDGGASANKAVKFVANTPVFNDLECHLLSVSEPTTKITRQMDEAADSLRAAGYSVTASIQTGQVEAVIGENISKDNIDLLIMGAYGHSRIRNLIIGSTTTAMIHSCKIPVLLFR